MNPHGQRQELPCVPTNIPQTLNSATITLGGNGLDSTDNMNYFEVIEFEVTKG